MQDGLAFQTLLGVTGSGKTYTMAQRHRTAAADRRSCWRRTRRWPRSSTPSSANSSRRTRSSTSSATTTTTSPRPTFPQRDLYIEKDSAINEHIEQMRLSATKSLLERRDVIIVATVSAIYGIGNPSDYHAMVLTLRAKDRMSQRDLIAHLTGMQYRRNETEFTRGTFRVRGDTIDIFPAEHMELAVRVELFDDEIDSLQLFDPLTGKIRQKIPRFTVYPSSHYVTPREHRAARDRDDQGRAQGAPRGTAQERQARRGAAPRAAHPLRPRDAQRARLLQGHRELHAAPVRRHARRTAADAGRLSARRCADVHRRVARD